MSVNKKYLTYQIESSSFVYYESATPTELTGLPLSLQGKSPSRFISPFKAGLTCRVVPTEPTKNSYTTHSACQIPSLSHHDSRDPIYLIKTRPSGGDNSEWGMRCYKAQNLRISGEKLVYLKNRNYE